MNTLALVRRIALAAALAACVTGAALAYAAAPVAVGGMDVQIWPEAEPGQTVVIASVTLPEKTKLPATVRIPLVAGMEIQWVGEISGADPSQDPTRTYSVDEGVGGRYVEFEVSTHRLAQVEMIGLPITTKGEVTSVSVPWVQSSPATMTAFSVRTIAGAREVVIQPSPAGAADTNEAGEGLHTLPSKELDPGDRATISVSYASGTAFEQDLADDGGATTVIWVLLGGIVVAGLFLVWVVRRQQRGA